MDMYPVLNVAPPLLSQTPFPLVTNDTIGTLGASRRAGRAGGPEMVLEVRFEGAADEARGVSAYRPS